MTKPQIFFIVHVDVCVCVCVCVCVLCVCVCVCVLHSLHFKSLTPVLYAPCACHTFHIIPLAICTPHTPHLTSCISLTLYLLYHLHQLHHSNPTSLVTCAPRTLYASHVVPFTPCILHPQNPHPSDLALCTPHTLHSLVY